MSKASQQLGYLIRIGLWVGLGALALAALMSVGILLFGSFGTLEVKVLLTSLLISGSSLAALPCGSLLGRGRWRPLAFTGLIATSISLLLLAGGMWGEVASEGFWRIAFTVFPVACACAHASLLLLPVLQRHVCWVQYVGIVLVAVFLAVVVAGIWELLEFGETLMRIQGAIVILIAAATVAVPVLARLRPGDGGQAAKTPSSSRPAVGRRRAHPPRSALPECLTLQRDADGVWHDADGNAYRVSLLSPKQSHSF